MEKRSILSSFQAWKQLRDIRSAFMHDYPEHANDHAEALTLAVDGAQELLAVLDRTKSYAADKIGIPVPEGRNES
jgi:hypothetical protein